MTDFTTSTPYFIRHLRLPRVTFPSLKIAATVQSFADSINRAFAMAYVEPFKLALRRPEIHVHADLEGRDPSW